MPSYCMPSFRMSGCGDETALEGLPSRVLDELRGDVCATRVVQGASRRRHGNAADPDAFTGSDVGVVEDDAGRNTKPPLGPLGGERQVDPGGQRVRESVQRQG